MSDSIQVDFREITYRGKEVSASALPSQTIPLDGNADEYDPDFDDADFEDEDYDDDWEDDEDEDW